MHAVTARILDGKAVAAQIRSEVSERVRAIAETGDPDARQPVTVTMLAIVDETDLAASFGIVDRARAGDVTLGPHETNGIPGRPRRSDR